MIQCKDCNKELIIGSVGELSNLGNINVTFYCIVCHKNRNKKEEKRMKENKDNIVDNLLLEALEQTCGIGNDEIDNQCISTYQDACDYLTEKGYLKKKNDRIYELVEKNNV